MLRGAAAFEEVMAAHQVARDARVRSMYEFTSGLALLEPPPEHMQTLFRALHGNQDATDAFLSAITGAVPVDEFFSAENVGRIVAAADRFG